MGGRGRLNLQGVAGFAGVDQAWEFGPIPCNLGPDRNCSRKEAPIRTSQIGNRAWQRTNGALLARKTSFETSFLLFLLVSTAYYPVLGFVNRRKGGQHWKSPSMKHAKHKSAPDILTLQQRVLWFSWLEVVDVQMSLRNGPCFHAVCIALGPLPRGHCQLTKAKVVYPANVHVSRGDEFAAQMPEAKGHSEIPAKSKVHSKLEPQKALQEVGIFHPSPKREMPHVFVCWIMFNKYTHPFPGQAQCVQRVVTPFDVLRLSSQLQCLRADAQCYVAVG